MTPKPGPRAEKTPKELALEHALSCHRQERKREIQTVHELKQKIDDCNRRIPMNDRGIRACQEKLAEIRRESRQ